MEKIIWLTLAVLAVILPSEAQFALPFETDCTAGRLLDPFLVQALKSKYPKKFSSKLDYGKDLGLDAKHRLGAYKLLARHMKNLNTLNYDIQNLMYQQQQQQQPQAMLQQPYVISDQASLLAQQPQLTNIQVPLADAARSILTAQLDPQQLSAFSQIADQRCQQPAFQLTPAQSLTSLRPQQALYHAAGVPLQL